MGARKPGALSLKACMLPWASSNHRCLNVVKNLEDCIPILSFVGAGKSFI